MQKGQEERVPFQSREEVVHVLEKGVSVTLVTLVTKPTRIASLATLVEEITPHLKKQCVADKGNDKANSRSSSV